MSLLQNSSFAEYHEKRAQEIASKYWNENLKANEMPLDDADWREIDKLLKKDLDRWLKRNALNFGYKYTS